MYWVIDPLPMESISSTWSPRIQPRCFNFRFTTPLETFYPFATYRKPRMALPNNTKRSVSICTPSSPHTVLLILYTLLLSFYLSIFLKIDVPCASVVNVNSMLVKVDPSSSLSDGNTKSTTYCAWHLAQTNIPDFMTFFLRLSLALVYICA